MKLFSLIYLFSFISFPAYLQLLDLKFVSLPNDDKLSGSFTTCIEQDTFGYIWIGTTSGLNRFNGYDFKVYKSVDEDNSTLVSNNIFNLFNDSRGRLWVGSGYGLSLYNRYKDVFERYATAADSSGLENFLITGINEDHKKNLYIATVKHLYRLNENEKRFTKILTIEDGDIASFLFDNNNNLWIGASAGGGLYCFNEQLTKFSRYTHDVNNLNSLSNNNVMSITLRSNELWMTTSGGGINRLDIQDMKFKRYTTNDPYEIYGKHVYVDKDDFLWQCDLTGLKLYDENSDAFYGYYYNEADPFSIKKSIVKIFQDRQGNYWSLHSPGSIGIRYVPKGFFSYDTNPARYWKTSNENISAICEDADGNLWLGNPNNGIDVFYWQKGKMITFLHNPSNIYSLGKGSVNTIFRDSKNIMWTGTYFGGLQYFDKLSGRFISFIHNPNDTNSIACNDVRSIAEDSKGNLWIVVHGKGVDKFDIRSKTFQHFNSQNNNLSNDWAFQVLCDNEDNIWVGTVWGLNRLNKGESTFQNFFSVENDSVSLSNSEIISLYLDSDNHIWIGTVNGLNFYNKDKNNFTNINLAAKSNYICAMLDDKEKNIWISTLAGLVKLDSKTLIISVFDKGDGLLANEFNVRAAYKKDINNLFFGNIKGVNVFNPDELRINLDKPKVIISNLRLFYEEVADYSPNSVLKKHISLTDTIILKYRQNILTLEYLALNMIQPEKNQYEYILEGFDPKWNKAGTKREAKYTNLDPGKYIFRVKASNNDGIWNDQGTSLFIRILPPWYRTWWFYSFCAVSIAGLFVLIYFVRTSQLRKQKRVLLSKVEERTKQLSEMNEILISQANDLNDINALLEERQQRIEEQSNSLAKANDELQMLNSGKDKLFSIIAHDLRGPFNNILGFSDILLKDFDSLEEIQKKNIAEYIFTSSNKVNNLLENLLNWAASQTNKLAFAPNILNIKNLITDVLNLFHDLAGKKDIDIIFEKIDTETVFADEDMVNTIIRNLLSNAIKFTMAGGTVEIEISRENNHAAIVVKDTGIGMDNQYLNKLFSPEYNESRPGTDDERGSGLGLMLCKEFIERNGGTITVKSIIGKGSSFIFTLPLFQLDK